jgi:two-component system, LytTR family, response regulator LytT
MKYKYLIVDDEPLARKLIASHTSKIEGLELAGECGSALEASNLLRNKSADLIFLDIQMPELNGLKFLSSLNHPPSIIITTAFREYGPEAFELDVIDYLMKPISFERLLKGVNRFFERRAPMPSSVVSGNEEESFLYLRADRKMHKIRLSEILYIESLDDYVKVFLRTKMLITRENITTLESRLPVDDFVRIHRSFLVSSKMVVSIASDGVEIANKILPFGRAFRQSALASLKIRL